MPYSKDMSKVYASKSTDDLRRLRSHKINKLQTIAGFNNYWAKKDREALDGQILQIEAELEARRLQLPLDLK